MVSTLTLLVYLPDSWQVVALVHTRQKANRTLALTSPNQCFDGNSRTGAG